MFHVYRSALQGVKLIRLKFKKELSKYRLKSKFGSKIQKEVNRKRTKK